jgi:hypothetical protein
MAHLPGSAGGFAANGAIWEGGGRLVQKKCEINGAVPPKILPANREGEF